MNPQRLAIRKIVYFCIAAVLLFPLVWIGRPASPDAQGGKLAALRSDARIGQSHFGQIDPASESARLATLGMQGFASMALWHQANEHKKKENWTAFEATLNKLAKIEPHFISVWKYQAHNLSYNISAEFADYRHRYEWVKKGIEFLKEGRKYNEHDPRMLHEIGWFICQKIGRSDERDQFRRMYLEEEGRDNWLVGKDWYLASQRLADAQNRPVPGLGRSVFHSQPAFAQIYYALALEEDGLPWDELEGLSHARREALVAQHLERWRQAWIAAGDDWFRTPESLGNRGFAAGQAFVVRFNDFEEHDKRLQAVADRLYALAPELADELIGGADRRDYLLAEESEALAAPREARTEEQRKRLAYAVPRLVLSHTFAERVPEEKRIEARRLADEARLEDFKVDLIDRLMQPIRFGGWKMRIQAEAEPEAVATQRYLAEARYFHRRGRLLPAKEAYEKAFAKYKIVLDKHPEMMDEVVTSNDMVDAIDAYRRLVEEDLDGAFPKEFVLQNVLDEHLPGSEAERNFKRRPAG
ncbi:MAG: hypothetical protein DCC68_18305 [Planctomycetota bacterium]|nr:MAG: hypothetical protein DCC68_18305 [Planctomycetota bacterium]